MRTKAFYAGLAATGIMWRCTRLPRRTSIKASERGVRTNETLICAAATVVGLHLVDTGGEGADYSLDELGIPEAVEKKTKANILTYQH